MATSDSGSAMALDVLTDEMLADLTRRVEDIDSSYRAVAEKMGQLFMFGDQNGIAGLKARLDKPIRNASENEQMFAALLDELRMQKNQR